MFPEFVKRLRASGHMVKYGSVGAEKMREYTIAAARNLHNFKYKNETNPPEFDKNLVDLSGIVDRRKYISLWSFASKVAIEQSKVMKEPNGEADFCTSTTAYEEFSE